MPPIVFARRPWCPLSAIEADAIAAHLPCTQPARRGRRPVDLRRTLDAVFWVAATGAPWRALPPSLGKPGSASRAWRRWADAGALDGLLAAAARGPAKGGCRLLFDLGFWIAQAFRLVARRRPMAVLARVRDALRVPQALPADPLILPDRNLSRLARAQVQTLGAATGLTARLVAAGLRRRLQGRAMALRVATARAAIRALRAAWRSWRLAAFGNRRSWRARPPAGYSFTAPVSELT
jgi:transposase